jgi:DNA repair protein SbcC/Rad50
MIPISLTIQGLYSYRRKQTINFAKLTQAGLFGIFGSVGCGKSTILEAISFALFGETERLNSRENRSYNMMNLKSNELLIDFEFKAGTEQRYRFIVKGKRNSKRFEDVKTFDRSAYKFENGDWQPIEISLVESIIGLNYNNFHRTIIIPQGQFQEFLQLSAKDRTVMLRELFNLDRFELFGRVVTLESRNNAVIQNYRGQLLSIGEVNPDDIIAKEQQLKEKQENLLKVTEELNVKQKREQEYVHIKALYQKLGEQKLHLSKLVENKEVVEFQEREVKEFERFVITFKSDFEQLKMLENNCAKTTLELKLFQNQHDKLKIAVQNQEKEFESIHLEFNQKEKLITKSDELLKLVEIHKLNEQNDQLSLRCENGKTALEAKKQSIDETRQKVTVLKEKIELTKKDLPDLVRLSAIREWFTQNRHLTNSISDLNIRIEKLKKEIQTKNAEALHLPKNQNLDIDLLENTDIKSINIILVKLKNDADQQKQKLEKEILHLEIINKLDAIASDLESGKPCPLCGSEHHPNILNAQNVSLDLLNVKSRQAKLTDFINKLNEAEKNLVKLSTQIISLNNQKQLENAHLQEYTLQLQEHQAKFNWTEFLPDNEAKLTEAFEKSKKLTQELEIHNGRLNELSVFIEKEELEKEKYIKYLEDFERQIVENSSKIRLLTEQLTHINIAENQDKPSETLILVSEDLKKRHDSIIQRHQEKEKQLTNLRNEYSVLSGRIEANQKALQSLTEDLILIDNNVKEKLQLSGSLAREYVESVLSKQLDTAVIKQQIETYRNELQTVLQLITQTESELQGKSYDEQLHTELKNQLISLAKLISEQNQEVGKMKTEIERQITDLEHYTILKAELDQLELRGQDIAEMKNLFKGSAFVNYISTVYLKNLCKVANDRFYKLIRQKLSLELAVDNSFEVRDFMNEGKLRNVKTLSGGQTFQASLSLALALADTIQKISEGHENFFFLDEGFGTLDKDSLNVVFDTLKSLRRENRIVGVISHVEEMQQEFETYLKVNNTEEEGSIVQASWEA